MKNHDEDHSDLQKGSNNLFGFIIYYLLVFSSPLFKLHTPKEDFSQRATAAQDILCVQISFNCILSTVPWRTHLIDDEYFS